MRMGEAAAAAAAAGKAAFAEAAVIERSLPAERRATTAAGLTDPLKTTMD
jgi:hypothetical protein